MRMNSDPAIAIGRTSVYKDDGDQGSFIQMLYIIHVQIKQSLNFSGSLSFGEDLKRKIVCFISKALENGLLVNLIQHILGSQKKCALCFRRFSIARYALYPRIWYQNQDQNMYIIIVTLNLNSGVIKCFCLETGLGAEMKVASLL